MVGESFEILIRLLPECRNGSAPTAHVQVVNLYNIDVSLACLVLLIPARLAQSKSTCWTGTRLQFLLLLPYCIVCPLSC